ncbi:MAG: HAMP domain-containing protein, partial [Chloroflexi bacterium]|nr:HAMP domain-containing protein [Chloroflexota bacterium]
MNKDRSLSTLMKDVRQSRDATLFGIVSTVLFGVAAIYALFTGALVVLGTFLPIFLVSLSLFWLAGLRRVNLGATLFIGTPIGTISLLALILPVIQAGLGVPHAITAFALIGGCALTSIPRRYISRTMLVGLILTISSLVFDQLGPPNRPLAGSMDLRWGMAISTLLALGFFLIRDFPRLDIRTKIVIGILSTGGISIGVLSLLAVNRSSIIIDTISRRLETSVQLLAEEQLANTVYLEADQANQFFARVSNDVASLAFQRESLQSRSALLSLGTLWDARTQLIPLEQGQYGNSSTDTASVFVPVNTTLDDALLTDLNTSAFLDLSAPELIESNPSVLAVYYIDPRKTVRYYPNISLATLIPPDFDATSRPNYRITSPDFNPNRLTKWTIPYVDATGGGLVVTVASPVYFGNEFNGVIAADIQLIEITQQVSAIRIGQTGYAFMLDDAGRIISMPPSGYDLFGINPQDLPPEEYFKQSVLGQGPESLSALTSRMVAGGAGLNILNLDGIETYITYSPVKETGYNLALVVPTSELQGAIAQVRAETTAQVATTFRLLLLLAVGMFAGAVLVSLIIGQVIARPVIRLTQTANQIVEGDVAARAVVTSSDEIGNLAQAFNTMTDRLRETLSGLEQRVEARTSDLAAVNEQLQFRARQFESIAQVSRVINQTQALDNLLPRIANEISLQFGYYHVGIFLLDLSNEFAVLVASNSEGGKRMLERNHKLKVGQVGIVGYAAGSGSARIALDTGADAVFFDNPDLPETRSEIALPLKHSGARPFGVLDVQSKVPNAFGQEDIQILSTLAEQVTLAIYNARLFG